MYILYFWVENIYSGVCFVCLFLLIHSYAACSISSHFWYKLASQKALCYFQVHKYPLNSSLVHTGRWEEGSKANQTKIHPTSFPVHLNKSWIFYLLSEARNLFVAIRKSVFMDWAHLKVVSAECFVFDHIDVTVRGSAKMYIRPVGTELRKLCLAK